MIKIFENRLTTNIKSPFEIKNSENIKIDPLMKINRKMAPKIFWWSLLKFQNVCSIF